MTHSGTRTPPLIERHSNNPILTAADWPYQCNTVFNPGATLLPDGTTLLLCRVEDMRGHSHLTVARSKDGISNWEIDPEPTLAPDIENFGEPGASRSARRVPERNSTPCYIALPRRSASRWH
jgi:hypothetical protein